MTQVTLQAYVEEISLDDSGSAPPSMAPPPLPPDYGASGATPQGTQGAGLGAWQAPSSGNSFNSAGPALATPSNNDDWDERKDGQKDFVQHKNGRRTYVRIQSFLSE